LKKPGLYTTIKDTMSPTLRIRFETWFAPIFLLALVLGFFALPFPLMDKLHGVCFGI